MTLTQLVAGQPTMYQFKVFARADVMFSDSHDQRTVLHKGHWESVVPWFRRGPGRHYGGQLTLAQVADLTAGLITA